MAYGSSVDGIGPLSKVEIVAPHVSNPLGIGECRALYVGTAGTVTCRMSGATADIALPLGVGWHPLRITNIRAAGTTALNMIAGV